MSSDIADNVLEQSVCQLLSLTGVSVEQYDLQACHHMRKKDQVIIKFKCRKLKHCILSNCKILQKKARSYSNKIFGKLFINDRMCHENHQ